MTLTGHYTDPGLLDAQQLRIQWQSGDPYAATDSIFELLGANALSLSQEVHSLSDDAILTITGINLPAGTIDFQVRYVYLDQLHTYPESRNGPYTVTVTVKDKDGAADTKAMPVTVRDVPPTVALTGPSVVNRNAVFLLRLGKPVDPGTDTVTRYRVNWGDGRVTEFTPALLTRLRGVLRQRYARTGTYTITVDVRDQETPSGWHQGVGTLTVTVLNAQIRAMQSNRVGTQTFTAVSGASDVVTSSLSYSWVVFDPFGRVIKSVAATPANPRPSLTFTVFRGGYYTVRLAIYKDGILISTINRKVHIPGMFGR